MADVVQDVFRVFVAKPSIRLSLVGNNVMQVNDGT